MKHTECKDCELSNGDCGYHFEMDGVTNYDIASLSACDKYGNCEFFKPKANPKGDLKSSEALKAYARKVLCGNNPTNSLLIRMFDEIIDNVPAVEIATKLQPNCNNLQQTQGEWVRKEDIIHLLEGWADGYSYIEIPTDTAIKAIKEMGGGAE